MKTGTEHIYIQFKNVQGMVEEYFAKGDKASLRVADALISYMEGLAFASLMSYKERRHDIELAVKMNNIASDYRIEHTELMVRIMIAETP